MNGTECVKRALCETSQQRTDVEPDSFLVEIMRAVFSLPSQGDIHGGRSQPSPSSGDVDPMHRLYDEAIATGRQSADCGRLFDRCEGSIWSGAFSI